MPDTARPYCKLTLTADGDASIPSPAAAEPEVVNTSPPVMQCSSDMIIRQTIIIIIAYADGDSNDTKLLRQDAEMLCYIAETYDHRHRTQHQLLQSPAAVTHPSAAATRDCVQQE